MRLKNTLTAVFITALVLSPVVSKAQVGGPGGQRGGWMRPPPAFAANMMNGTIFFRVDPDTSAELLLLRRNDVRSALLMDGSQQQKINQLLVTLQTSQNKATLDSRMNAFASMRGQFKNFSSLNPQQRQAQMDQMRKQMQQNISGETTKEQKAEDAQLATVLNQWQMNKLHQLDYQFRSALALDNADVAKPFNLTTEQTTQIKALYNQYMQEERKTITDLLMPQAPPAQTADTQPTTPAERRAAFQQQMQKNMADMNAKMQDLQAHGIKLSAPLDAKRQALGKQVMALLNPDQKQMWIKLEGPLFYFNPNTSDATVSDNS